MKPQVGCGSARSRLRRVSHLRVVVVAANLLVAFPSFAAAQVSEDSNGEVETASHELHVRSWEHESLHRARRNRLALRRLRFERAQLSQQEVGADVLGGHSRGGESESLFSQRRDLLESARGQPWLTGLEPLPVSLFVP